MNKNIFIILFIIIAGFFNGFGSIGLPVELMGNYSVSEHISKPVTSRIETATAFTAKRQCARSLNINTRKDGLGATRIKLSQIKLGSQFDCANSYRPLLGKMYSKGVYTRVEVKYAALMSIAVVWNITWGLRLTDSGSHQSSSTRSPNNVTIAVTVSDPAPPSKNPSVFMHKLDTNLPLETLSTIDVIVTFAHI